MGTKGHPLPIPECKPRRTGLQKQMEEFDKNHKCCPNCGNDNIEQTTMSGMTNENGIYTDTSNRAFCHKCRWHGKVCELIPENQKDGKDSNCLECNIHKSFIKEVSWESEVKQKIEFDIKRMNLKPDDILVITVDADNEVFKIIEKNIKEMIPSMDFKSQFLVLPKEIELSIVSKDEIKKQMEG